MYIPFNGTIWLYFTCMTLSKAASTSSKLNRLKSSTLHKDYKTKKIMITLKFSINDNSIIRKINLKPYLI